MLALVAVASIALPAVPARAVTKRKTVRAVTLAAGSGAALQVTWVSSPTGIDVDHWMIALEDTATKRIATHLTACASCRTATIPDAVTGRAYKAEVWPVEKTGAAGRSSKSSVFTLTDGLCGTDKTAVCAAIDGRNRIEPMAHRAGGLNGGWDGTTTEPWRVDLIGPTSARVDVHTDAATWAELKRRALPTTFMVDSWWRTERQALGQSILPWSNVVLYQADVARLAAGLAAAGQAPDFWDISNEPDVAGVYGDAAPTRDQLLTQYRLAFQAIRGVIPNAKIIGPSLQGFFWDEPDRALDLKSFIAFADANQLPFYAISWHENGVESDLDDLWATSGRTIASHVARMRVALAGTTWLKQAKPFVSEVVPAWMSALPGGMVGWMSHAEGSGAEQMGLTCWPTPNDPAPGQTNPMTACGLGTFDGLAHSNGLPTSTWWPHYQYRWTLDGWRVDSRVNQLGWSVLATTRDDGTVNALLGRSESCRPDVNPLCPPDIETWLRARPGRYGTGTGAAVDAKVVVATAMAAGRAVTVTAFRYAAKNTTYAGMPQPVAEVSLQATTAKDGTVTLTLPKVVDGDAWLVTVAPSS